MSIFNSRELEDIRCGKTIPKKYWHAFLLQGDKQKLLKKYPLILSYEYCDLYTKKAIYRWLNDKINNYNEV